MVTRAMRSYGIGPYNWALIWKQLLIIQTRSHFIIPGYNYPVSDSFWWMRWWAHQHYLVNNYHPVDHVMWIPPPCLKDYLKIMGIGYFEETSPPPFPNQLGTRISLEDAIYEAKPADVLEGWIAFGTPPTNTHEFSAKNVDPLQFHPPPLLQILRDNFPSSEKREMSGHHHPPQKDKHIIIEDSSSSEE